MSEAAAIGRMPEPEHGHAAPAVHHKVNYLAVFITLVVLTAVTVIVAFAGIKSEMVKVLLALAIASVKASAVVIYFMHMKFEGKLIYVILIVPLTFCVMLVIALLPDVTFAPLFHDVSVHEWRFGADQ